MHKSNYYDYIRMFSSLNIESLKNEVTFFIPLHNIPKFDPLMEYFLSIKKKILGNRNKFK